MEDPVDPQPAGADPLLGRLLAGQYRVDARIGAGAMGVVYRARHALLHQDFAVKVLSGDLAGDSDARRRFLAEAKVLTALVHPAVVQVRHFGEEEGLVYLVMDLCGGETLQSLLEREGAQPARRACAIAVRILEALEAAHAKGVIHRDLKPANVMVRSAPEAGQDRGDDVRVLDFGLARVLKAQAGTSVDMFASSHTSVVGSVAYMSPEQLNGAASIDARSDLFSVGVVLYEMLTGKRPFDGDSTFSVALKILQEEPAPLRAPESRPALPTALQPVIAGALAKDPAQRFPSAGAFADALRAAAAGGNRGSALAAVPPPQEARRPRTGSSRRVRRSRRFRAALALVAAATVTWGGISWKQHSDEAATRHAVAETRHAARTALLAGYLDLAVKGFRGLIASDAATPQDHLFLGQALTELGDTDAVLELYRAHELEPGPRVRLAQSAALRQFPAEEKASKLLKMIDTLFAIEPPDLELADDLAVERVRLRISLRDFDRASNEVSLMESRAPSAQRAPLLRALVEIEQAAEANDLLDSARQSSVGTPQPEWDALEAVVRTAAERARERAAEAARDPDLAEASVIAAKAFEYLERTAQRAGDEATRMGFSRSAEHELAEAVRRAERNPEYHQQGIALARYYRLLSQRRNALREHAGSVDPAWRAWDRHRTIDAYYLYAEALMASGRYEEALRAYGRPEASADQNAPFRIGFCHQRIGQRAAERGDVPAAKQAYQAALVAYGAEIERKLRNRMSVEGERAYAAQTHVWRSALPRRAIGNVDDLAEAQALFDTMATTSDFSVLERRSEYHSARGRRDAALADIRGIVKGKTNLEFIAYRRLVRCLLDVAEVLAPSRKEEALNLARQAIEEATSLPPRRMPERTEVYLLEAEALTRFAEIAGGSAEASQAAGTALEKLDVAEASLPDERSVEVELVRRLNAEVRHARAKAHLARGEAGAAYAEGREAVLLREAEEGARRWVPDPVWYDELAKAAQMSGNEQAAQRARARARQLREE